MARKIYLSEDDGLISGGSEIGSVSQWTPFRGGELPPKIGSVWYFGQKSGRRTEPYIFVIKILDKSTLRFYDSDRRTDTNYVTYSI
jgi:hypothetical protein